MKEGFAKREETVCAQRDEVKSVYKVQEKELQATLPYVLGLAEVKLYRNQNLRNLQKSLKLYKGCSLLLE